MNRPGETRNLVFLLAAWREPTPSPLYGFEVLVMEIPGRFLTAQWRHLLMLNFEVDPKVLGPLVPRGTQLDFHGGKTYLSMVGFRFEGTRVLGLPTPFHGDFEEVNLRFYVGRECKGEWRRGVVFVKEIVPRPLIAWIARTIYNEQYVALPMRHAIRLPTDNVVGQVRYQWRHAKRWHGLGATFAGEPQLPAPGSLEEFITEHYWGYALQRDGSTTEYQVEHPQWPVWRAEQARFDCDTAGFYGERFAPSLSCEPASAFVAVGSPIIVRKGLGIC